MTPPPGTTSDVVVSLVMETFDDLVRREFTRPPDRALLAFAASTGVGRLLVADPWRSLPVDVLKRRDLRGAAPVQVAGRDVLRLRPRRLRRTHPTGVRSLERSFRRYAADLGRLAGYDSRSGAAVVTYDPFVAAFADADWITRMVYVGQDDFTAADGDRPWWEAYEEAYRRIAVRCDAVFTISDELSARVAPGTARTSPNGIDPALWAPAARHPLRAELADRVGDGPYAVYAGSVEGRVDDSLFDEVLSVVPKVVIAGACYDQPQIERMRSLPGMVLLGNLNQQDLVGVVSGASVGLINHHDTRMTRAMSPMKMYEYLAAGLPVVSTDLPPVRDGGERVWLCRTRREWAPAVRQALASGVLADSERVEVISRISWDRRLSPVVAAALASAP